MEFALVDEAIALLEKANADLEPELLSGDGARALLATYARAEKLAAHGKTVLARRVDDAHVVARAAGTSRGRAQATVDAGKALGDADQVRAAFRAGDISFDQAAEIAPAERARPGSAPELVAAAGTDPFHVLQERARKTVLEAEQQRDLSSRQHAALGPPTRSALRRTADRTIAHRSGRGIRSTSTDARERSRDASSTKSTGVSNVRGRWLPSGAPVNRPAWLRRCARGRHVAARDPGWATNAPRPRARASRSPEAGATRRLCPARPR